MTDERFDSALRRLREAAGLTLEAMILRGKQQEPPALFTKQALSDWFTGKVRVPQDSNAQDRLILLLEAEARRRDPHYQPHPIGWWRALREAQRDPRDALKREPLGRVIGSLSDEDALLYEVHRSIRTLQPGASLLPPYIERTHDAELRRELSAAETSSRVVMLVGESSTGKTRACWEAIRAVLPDWRVWHPLMPDRPGAVVEQLTAGRVEPRTVIWLNEAQMYLQSPGVGERVASILQHMRHAGGGPILILGSMWPTYWDELTKRKTKKFAAARSLLNSTHRIRVPPDFTARELTEARDRIAGDDRLRAAAVATDAGITQFLAAGPEILRRYEDSDEYRKAIIHAALDAKRLGNWLHSSTDFLRDAAVGYLSPRALGKVDGEGRWFENAVGVLLEECHGADGPLSARRDATDRLLWGYKLADYLEQHVGQLRPISYPPDGFWTAVVHCCKDSVVLYNLAQFAERHGTPRRAATLVSLAAELGNTTALRDLARTRYKAGDYEGAERYARRAAELGDFRALRELAQRRRGIVENPEHFLREAAMLGTDSLDFDSQIDKHEEAHRLRPAADLGHNEPQGQPGPDDDGAAPARHDG